MPRSWLSVLVAVGVAELAIFFAPPIFKAAASFALVLFLPGYCLSRLLYGPRPGVWRVVFSGVVSLFMAMLIALPSILIKGEISRFPLSVSFGVFCTGCLTMERLVKPKPRRFATPQVDAFFVVIVTVFILLQIVLLFVLGRDLEPSNPDWAYEVGMITQLRRFPPVHPEATWTLLKQPWGYWGVYALLVSLSGLPVIVVLKTISVIFSFLMLSLVYLLCGTFFSSCKIGVWAALFLATTSEIRWLLDSVVSRRLVLTRIAQGTVQTSGDNLTFAWYNTPALIGSVFVVYHVVRYYLNREKTDWIIAILGASLLPFLHPTFYGLTMGGLALFVLLKHEWKTSWKSWLPFAATIVPFILVYKVLLYTDRYTPLPLIPVNSLGAMRDNIVWYIGYCGLLVPLALISIIRASKQAGLFAPFAFIASFLAITTYNLAGNYHWYYDLNAVWLAVLAGIGLVELGKAKSRIYQFIYIGLIGFTVITTTNSVQVVPRYLQGYRIPPHFRLPTTR